MEEKAGTPLWSVALCLQPNKTSLLLLACKLGSLRGFYSLWIENQTNVYALFDSYEAAVSAWIAIDQQMPVGKNVCRWVLNEEGEPILDIEWNKSHCLP